MSGRYTGSVRSKVILITLLCTTTILTAVGVFDTLKVVEDEKAQLRKLVSVTAKRIAQHLLIPVWDLDVERISNAITAEMLENSLLAIAVYDEDGKTILGAKERDRSWSISASSGVITDAFAKASSNIKNKDQIIGRVDVYISDQFVNQNLQSLIIKEVGRVVVLNASIFLVLLLFLGRYLIEPVRILAEKAIDISTGKLNTAIEINSNDEIGMLADSLTRMQKSMIVVIKKLRQKDKIGGQPS